MIDTTQKGSQGANTYKDETKAIQNGLFMESKGGANQNESRLKF